MLGSKGPVKTLAVVGLGKEGDAALSPSALEAIGVQVLRGKEILCCHLLAPNVVQVIFYGFLPLFFFFRLIIMYAKKNSCQPF